MEQPTQIHPLTQNIKPQQQPSNINICTIIQSQTLVLNIGVKVFPSFVVIISFIGYYFNFIHTCSILWFIRNRSYTIFYTAVIQ